MLRKRGGRVKGMGWSGAGILMASLLSALSGGCGKQDLYQPPRSPYEIVSRLSLPSAAEGVSILDSHVFVAGGEAGLLAIDLTDPRQPRLIGSADTPKEAGSVAAASTQDGGRRIDFAFVTDGTEGIDVFDVTRPDSIVTYPYFDTYDARGVCVEVAERPDQPYSVYVADSWRGCWRLDSVPGAPGSVFMAGRTYTIGAAQAVAVADGFAYVADDEMGLVVVDPRVPVAMGVVSSCDTPGAAQGVAVKDGYAYIADGKNGLVVMTIHQGDVPVPVGHLVLPGTCRSIAVRDNIALIAAQDGGTHVVDVTNPADPRLAGTVMSAYATGVALGNSGIAVISDRDEGLIILGSIGAFHDVTAPATVADLSAVPRDQSSIVLHWHAPGNDMYNGAATRYDIRYSTAPITAAGWDSAMTSTDPPSPSTSGTEESHRVTGLDLSTEYYFALRAGDAAGNWSGISNVCSAVTFGGNVPPALTGASFNPEGTTPDSTITFEVTYTDPDGDVPARADVVINGESFPLVPQGGDYAEGVIFRLEKLLAKGSYEHYFAFDDGQGHAVSTPVTPGPWIGNIFIVGSPADEVGRDTDEDQHLVVLEWNYQISDHEVTQAEWDSVAALNPGDPNLPLHPSHFTGAGDLPVENVTFYNAVAFCNALSTLRGYTPCYTILGDSVAWNHDADGYRLPTEAEWEQAARGGTRTAFATGNLTVETCRDGAQPDPVLDQIGWYCGNALDHRTHPIKTKQPITWNGQQLWDMNGNVWEWCWDWYSPTGVVGDPTGPARGSQRVIRGGSWYYFARDCRAAARAPYWPNSKDDIVGFRVARTIP